MSEELVDIAVVGAGAAGLFAAIHAGRTSPGLKIVALDGAKTLGAKILVAGGGRCNVTHFEVDEKAFAGSTGPAIRNVLRRFDVERTVEFFREGGVELKREETGKLFPVTDDARTVLDCLLKSAREAGVEIRHPWRVERVVRRADPTGKVDAVEVVRRADPTGGGFVIEGPEGTIWAKRVILATGGKALPKSGSDGQGYSIAKGLGHTMTARIFPALVPLLLEEGFFLMELSGISAPARLEVRNEKGARIAAMEGSVLCTHRGLSGPGVLDISRYFLEARMDARKEAPGGGGDATLSICWLPDRSAEELDRDLQRLGSSTPLRLLKDRLPDRLLRALFAHAGVDPLTPGGQMTKEGRRGIVQAFMNLPLPVTGDRGFTHAEVTAGGVPLKEVRLETMESRVTPGLHLCGEICDVDGRIGGFNFQWAWASGFVAGAGAGEMLK